VIQEVAVELGLAVVLLVRDNVGLRRGRLLDILVLSHLEGLIEVMLLLLWLARVQRLQLLVQQFVLVREAKRGRDRRMK